ncbi:hypothetical protein HG530_011022 [Fusarium avenaceum]|nr:hypothetical protein HG530_011022 [Fusarium avenaceum]
MHRIKGAPFPSSIAHHSKSSINGVLGHKGENLHISAHPDTPSSPSMNQAPGMPNRQMLVVPVHPDRARPFQASSQLSHPVVFLPANIGALHGTEQVLGCVAGVSGGLLG